MAPLFAIHSVAHPLDNFSNPASFPILEGSEPGPVFRKSDEGGVVKLSKLYRALYFQVLIGLALGIAVGHYWPEFGASLKPLGDGLVKLVIMMFAPVVFCTMVLGITCLNDGKHIG